MPEPMAERQQHRRDIDYHLAVALSNVPMVLSAMDLEGNFTLSEGKGLELIGLSPGQVVGMNALDMYADFPDIVRSLHRALSGEPVSFESTLGDIHFLGVYVPNHDASGDVQGVTGLGFDVSDRVQAQRAAERALAQNEGLLRRARESEALFRAVFEQVAVGVVLCDLDGRFLEVNPGFCEICGYTAAELAALSFREISHPDDLREDVALYRQLLAGEIATYSMEKRYIRKDGEVVWVSLTVSPRHTNDEVTGLLGVVKDISKRKRTEQRMADQLAEKETLLREIHHRVKNNLQVVSSLLGLQERRSDPGPAQEALRQSARRVGAMALVHEKLYGSSDVARVSFPSYARELADTLLATFDDLPGRIQLRVEGPPRELAPDQIIPLGLIVTELVSNAFKHAFPDGRPGSVRIVTREEPGTCEIEIHDDGIGYSAPPGDAGLGLHLVARLAEQLGATVTKEGPPGTRVTVRLPLYSGM